MHLDHNFVLSNLCLQLHLDSLLCLLLLNALLNEVEQLILVRLDLPFLFLNLSDLISQLLFHLLGLQSGFSQLSLETRLHIFLFVGLQSLKLIERVYKVLVVGAQLLGLSLRSQHLDKAINV